MLQQLYIKNFALIDELNIDFHPGFSVITGETGAGKSIILGAIGLLLGKRAESKQVKTGEKKCTIEAHFSLQSLAEEVFVNNGLDYEPDDTILRREVSALGKSRAFINDTPVSLQLMRTIGEQLVDIHSQHQNLLLQTNDFQLQVVDIIANCQASLAEYRSSFNEYQKEEQHLTELQQKLQQAKKEEDFRRFQYQELESAQLIENEQEDLEQESKTLSHAEDIKTSLYEADNLLSNDEKNVVSNLQHITLALQHIEGVFPKIAETAKRLEAVNIELQDIANDVSNDVESIDFDPQRLDAINNRLDLIYSLQQKYHVTSSEELIEIKDQLKTQLAQIDQSDETLSEIAHRVTDLRNKTEEKAKQLTKLRQKAAKKVEEEMRSRLIPLGIPNVRFEIKIMPCKLNYTGADQIEFLFSANKSTEMQPIAEVASGGEIARVMLSLKAMIGGVVNLPTIIFDEIDTGVSGKIAQKMAQIMQEMAANQRQVISITHLPQIAAAGTTHYKVEKQETTNGTISRMRQLTNKERIQEIAQMLSGNDISEAAIQNAKELLNL